MVAAKAPCGGYPNRMGFEDSGYYADEYGYGESGWRHHGPGRHHGGGWFKGSGNTAEFEARINERLDRAKSQLGITGEQEPAWNEFTTQLRQAMETRKARRGARMRDAVPTVEERIEFMRQKATQMRELADAMAKLHAQLTTEQQKTADALPMGRMGRKGPPM